MGLLLDWFEWDLKSHTRGNSLQLIISIRRTNQPCHCHCLVENKINSNKERETESEMIKQYK